jgi:hypothetical protein
MNKTCIVQYAWGSECLEQTQLTIGYTFWGCSKFKYDYRCYYHEPVRHPVWEKPKLLLKALEDGYESVIWLDSDSLWLADKPLHSIHSKSFGMTYHHVCNQQTLMNHYNAGVIFLNNLKDTIDLVKEWLYTSDDNHQWLEQYALNKILIKHPEYIEKLPHRYNSVVGISEYQEADPIIVSWHGSQNRNNLIRNYIAEMNK